MNFAFVALANGMRYSKRSRAAAESLTPKVKIWEYNSRLIGANLNLREKRFLAHCELEDGEEITAHCPNPGAMKGFGLETKPSVVLTKSTDTKRKLPWTLECVKVKDNWVNCNTMLPNRVIAAALRQRAIPELDDYVSVQSEVKYGTQNSRIDFVLTSADGVETYLEVKSVTLREDFAGNQPVATFPDCKSTRGKKHMEELRDICQKKNKKSVVLLFVNRTDVNAFAPSNLDPDYKRAFYDAVASGVKPLPYVFETDPETGEVFLYGQTLPVLEEHQTPELEKKRKPSSKRSTRVNKKKKK